MNTHSKVEYEFPDKLKGTYYLRYNSKEKKYLLLLGCDGDKIEPCLGLTENQFKALGNLLTKKPEDLDGWTDAEFIEIEKIK